MTITFWDSGATLPEQVRCLTSSDRISTEELVVDVGEAHAVVLALCDSVELPG